MSRKKLILVSLAGMFMLAESLYAQNVVGTYSIAFDGYCDGATVTLSATSSFVSGTHDNWDCHGSQTWLDGVNSTLVGKFPREGLGPVAVADNVGVLVLDNSALTLYLNFNKKTWGLYIESGGVLPETLLNMGTFTILAAPLISGPNRASWQAQTLETDPAFVLTGYPKGTYDLLLYDSTDTSEYCDFLHVTAQAHRVGGYHDLSTSCGEANAPSGGNYATLANDVVFMNNGSGGIVGVAGRSLLTTDNEAAIDSADDFTLNYYFNFDKMVWSLYGTDGTTGLQLLNWGYFTVVKADPLTTKPVAHPVGGMRSSTPHH